MAKKQRNSPERQFEMIQRKLKRLKIDNYTPYKVRQKYDPATEDKKHNCV